MAKPVSPLVTLLHPTRIQRLRLSLSHAVPGILLVLIGLTGLREEGLHLLPIAEVAAGASVLIAVVQEIRRHGKAGHGAVGWVEVCAGIMLIVEGWHAHHPGRGFQPATLYFLAGLATIAIGAGYARIPRLRRMVLDDEHLHIRTAPFRSMGMAWRDVVSIETGPRTIAVRTREGKRHAIDLGAVENREEVVRTFAAWGKERVGKGRKATPPVVAAALSDAALPSGAAPPATAATPVPAPGPATSARPAPPEDGA